MSTVTITLVYKTLYYACYRVCDVTYTTAGVNTQPGWQPTTAGDAVTIYQNSILVLVNIIFVLLLVLLFIYC